MTVTERDDDADRWYLRDAALDPRPRILGDRDGLGDDRQDGASGRERDIDVETIFAAADLRDVQADARDFAADQRDMAANLDAFVRDIDDAEAFDARECARRDRLRSKADRVASELDRYLLTDAGPQGTEHNSATAPRIVG